MKILLKTSSVRVSYIQTMQIRVQNKSKSVWKSRYDGYVSVSKTFRRKLGNTIDEGNRPKQLNGISPLHLGKERDDRIAQSEMSTVPKQKPVMIA